MRPERRWRWCSFCVRYRAPLFFRNFFECHKCRCRNRQRGLGLGLVSSGFRLFGALYSGSSRLPKPSGTKTARAAGTPFAWEMEGGRILESGLFA